MKMRVAGVLVIAAAALGVRAHAQVNAPYVPAAITSSYKDFENGVRAARQKRYNDAIASLTGAINQLPAPQVASALLERGIVYCELRQCARAKSDFDAAVRAAPRAPSVYMTAGANAFRCEHDADALHYYEAGLKRGPDDAPLLNDVAWFRATCPNSSFRDGPQAVALAKRACERTQWRNPSYVDTQAAAEAEAGLYSAAIEHEEQAIRSGKLSPTAQKRLNEYKRRQPHHERPND